MGNGGLITTRVGLLRGGSGGVFSAMVASATFFTVEMLKLEPRESLLDAILSFEGDEVTELPLLVLRAVRILSVDAERALLLTYSGPFLSEFISDDSTEFSRLIKSP